MRPERLYLMDMLEAADAIATFLHGRNEQSFLADDLLRSAILHKLTIIGEAAAKLPLEFRQRYAHIPWANVVGFRNIAVHAYFSVEWTIVWVTANDDTPQLKKSLAAILESEFGNEQTVQNTP
jgi:uncharacterized protein with HEPN domain